MFDGYYNEPELTKASFDEEGFYKTGDTGDLDADDFLQVKGRVKDTFKTNKGEFIVPTPIEDKFATNSLIEQICLVGLGLPQPIGLIQLSEASKNLGDEEVKTSLGKTLETVNEKLHRHEIIHRLVCVSDAWTIENSMLTPTMKIKRNAIHDAYKNQYEDWYKQEETVIIE